MNESKVAITERLRREGRWGEASKYRDEVRAELRRQGHKRADAAEKAWQAMSDTYPPLSCDEPDANGSDDSLALLTAGDELSGTVESTSDPDLVRDALWVYDHLDLQVTMATQAPSRGAWSMLRWARGNRDRFFEQMLPKAMIQAKRQETDQPSPMLDDTTKLEWLDNYLAQLGESHAMEQECPACSAKLVISGTKPQFASSQEHRAGGSA